jgi:hypothetical protein
MGEFLLTICYFSITFGCAVALYEDVETCDGLSPRGMERAAAAMFAVSVALLWPLYLPVCWSCTFMRGILKRPQNAPAVSAKGSNHD